MKKYVFIMVLSLSLTGLTRAQDTTGGHPADISLSGFAEIYYSYDCNQPADGNRPSFLYSHNRHNEFNLNLAFVKASYSKDRVRANLALAAGTYMNANYAAEPGGFRHIMEANAGVKLSSKGNVWLDAGILPSHIGFESAQSSVCVVLTRSMLAENSPYFESGARLSFTSANSKWYLAGLALNGWQRIQRVPGNSMLSWGAQLTYTPSAKVSLNYSNFIGTDKPDSNRLVRTYHNIYGTFHLSGSVVLITGFDLGTEQVSKGSRPVHTWFSPVLILQYKPCEKWAIACRGEYYNDPKGVLISTSAAGGFKTTGVSLNADRSIGSHFIWRTELRVLDSKHSVFIRSGKPVSGNTAITTSFAVTL